MKFNRLQYICTVMVVLLSGLSYAQQKKQVDIWNPPVQKGLPNLKPGDVLQDFKFKVFNDIKKTAAVSDYSDRLLIFDFGNTGCGGCIAALPHMDQLQKEFGDKIKIFWVTPESYEAVQRMWNRKGNKYTLNNTLPTIVDDSTARAYFRHNSWPHEAWVYKGKVIALTGPDYVDAVHIKQVLSGAPVNWPVKNDFYVFDRSKPLFTPDSSQHKDKYAIISGYKEGINSTGLSGGSGVQRDPVKKTVRAYFLNQPIFNAYLQNWMKVAHMNTLAKPPGIMPGPNEIVWEVKDRSVYRYNNKDYQQDWIRKNGICFESVNPDTGQTDLQVAKTVITDLDSLLGLRVRWEKRREKVLVLVRTTKEDKLKSKKSVQADELHPDVNHKQQGTLHQFRDWTLANLSYIMNQEEENPYVFDETGFEELYNVDMDLNFSSWKDIPALRKSLLPYGLDLKEEERVVDKFVFTEVKK